jgi:hypothetical protein
MLARLAPLAAACLLLLGSGCGGGGGSGSYDPDPVGCAFVPGQVTSSTGGPNGSAYYGLLLDEPGTNLYIWFNNINLTFAPRQYDSGATVVESEIVYLGGTCLDSLPGWPGGTTAPVTALLGGTYMVRFERTYLGQPTTVHYGAFTVDAYSGGVVTYTWLSL